MIRNMPKQAIFASSRLALLQMVSEPDTGRCANEDTGLQGGWIVRSHVGWRWEQNIPYKSIETSPPEMCF